MAYRVLIPQEVTAPGKIYLLERGYEIKMGKGTTVEALKEDVRDCDAVLLRTALFSEEVIAAGPKLKVIARHGVGYDNIDLKAATSRGIYVTFTPMANANTVAEFAVTMMSVLGKKLKQFESKFRDEGFDARNALQSMDLEGKTLGLIGLGRIGMLVGKKASRGFDMDVIGYDPYVKPEQCIPEIKLTDDLEHVLGSADFISLHVPFSEQTRNLISHKQLSLMKPAAYIINASRGGVIDEDALVEALRNRTIAGAGLDVFEMEPPPREHPLFRMDNVIVTPHCAAHSQESMERMSLHAAIGIDEVLNGKTPSWPVNHPLVK